MSIRIQTARFVLCGLVALSSTAVVNAQSPAATAAGASKAQQVVDRAADEGKYAFILFFKASDKPTNAMAATLKQALEGRSDTAVAYVQVTDPAEQALVAEYGVARAPMPMTVALAPNGAVTGVYPRQLTQQRLGGAFVTPTMMFTMKSLQEGKLVLVNVQGSAGGPAPVALQQFLSDPHFQDRLVTTSMRASDPHEAKFVQQMKLDANASASSTVLIAPPGVMVGKFAAGASKDEIAAALAEAGKCCEDPNCKHHQ